MYVKKTDNLYYSFTIPKKNGGFREINTPHNDLKLLQIKLSTALLNHQRKTRTVNNIKPNFSHGFEKGKSFMTNAHNHINKRFVLNIDLENFFGSIHFGRVKGYFLKNKHFNLPSEVATVIAQISCYRGTLPQGAPTSPLISNMICEILDYKINKICQKYRLKYTRYADDLSFSTNDKYFLDRYDDFYDELIKTINISGFKVNKHKERLQFCDSRQEVTGLVVNEKLNIKNDYYKKTRAMAHNLYTKGEFIIDGNTGSINQLEGRFSFINQIQRYNNMNEKIHINLNNKKPFYYLNGKELQYQKFLFYKYFYANPKPLVVTEGKTDILYLKAALINLYSEYPNLINKNEKTQLKYNISFLNKTRRLKYFLNITEYGADTMLNIYNFYSNKGGKKFTNYIEAFSKISNITPLNPVILIFDNEINTKQKPLAKFANHLNLDSEQRGILKKGEALHICHNLYALTVPLGKKQERELEDLFDEHTLTKTINGKAFSRSDQFDEKKYYGKNIFAHYVYRNRAHIEFNGFKTILDEICSVINNNSTYTSHI